MSWRFFRPDLATVETREAEPPSDAIAYNIRRHTDLPEATNYGVEIAVPYGQWVYKLEVLHQESFVSLNGQSLLCTNTMGNTVVSNCDPDEFQEPTATITTGCSTAMADAFMFR